MLLAPPPISKQMKVAIERLNSLASIQTISEGRLGLRTAQGFAEASAVSASEFNSLCSILLSSLPYRCSQRHSPVDLLHGSIYLKVFFLRNSIYDYY